MNVTVGKLRPLSRMVNPVWRAFMPISKWSQHDALAPELTTTGSQKPPSVPFTMFDWVKQRLETTSPSVQPWRSNHSLSASATIAC